MTEEKNLYTLDEFYRRNNTTRHSMEKLWALGLGPRKTYVGANVRISAKAEREWLEALEDESGKHAQYMKEEARKRKLRAQHAGRTPYGRQLA